MLISNCDRSCKSIFKYKIFINYIGYIKKIEVKKNESYPYVLYYFSRIDKNIYFS